jgi:hypothetical protein
MTDIWSTTRVTILVGAGGWLTSLRDVGTTPMLSESRVMLNASLSLLLESESCERRLKIYWLMCWSLSLYSLIASAFVTGTSFLCGGASEILPVSVDF